MAYIILPTFCMKEYNIHTTVGWDTHANKANFMEKGINSNRKNHQSMLIVERITMQRHQFGTCTLLSALGLATISDMY